eukprot:GFKZ01009517.1.p1 GENE.GFKZ01009517.1~~GFKZ01009517.1.p1  ORF type:complete len:516 (+),score=50.83 GFKZ01009517.1:219-1766(+)
MNCISLFAFTTSLYFCFSIANAGLSFTDVTSRTGLSSSLKSFKFGGPCVADLDGDGYYDLMLSHHNRGKMQIYFGNENGTFTLSPFVHEYFDIHGVNVAQRMARSPDRILSISLGGGSGGNLKTALVYLISRDRVFREITTEYGLGRRPTRGRSTLFMDLSPGLKRRNRGGPDLMFVSYLGPPSAQLRQFGYQFDGRNYNLRRVPVFEKEVRGRVEVTDIDGDGQMEIISIRELQVYKLVRFFSFRDVTPQTMPRRFRRRDKSLRNTAVAEIDFDNDGHFDLYVARADRSLVTRRDPYEGGTTTDLLLRNVNGRYVNVTEGSGIPSRTNSIGVCAGDFNNDGYMDLLVIQWSDPDFFLINNGNGTFKKVGGLIPKARNTVGNNAVAVDYNLDGRLDAIVGQGAPADTIGPYLLMKNTMSINSGQANYLLVRVRNAPGYGRTALHALITVEVNGRKMVRHVGSSGAQAGGGSYLDTVHFGLGGANRVNKVTVRWTDLTKKTKRGVRANQLITIGVE